MNEQLLRFNRDRVGNLANLDSDFGFPSSENVLGVFAAM
jgi:hypothetical protein